MNLRAFSDRHRIWIEDVDDGRDDPGQALVRFRVPTNVEGPIPKRTEKRLLAIAETMGDRRERLRTDPPAATTGGCASTFSPRSLRPWTD